MRGDTMKRDPLLQILESLDAVDGSQCLALLSILLIQHHSKVPEPLAELA